MGLKNKSRTGGILPAVISLLFFHYRISEMSFSFGSPQGFTFGRPQVPQQQQPVQQFPSIGAFGAPQTATVNPNPGFGTVATQPAPQEQQPSSGGFTFGAPSSTSAPSTGFTFGMQTAAVSAPSAPSTGFSFGMNPPASTGIGTSFSFGTQQPQQTPVAASMTTTPAASTTSMFGTNTGSFFSSPSTVAQVAPQPQVQQQQQQSTGFTFGVIQPTNPTPSLATSTTASLWSTHSAAQSTGFGTLTQPKPATTQPTNQFGFGLGTAAPSFESSFTTPVSSAAAVPTQAPSIGFSTGTQQSGFSSGGTTAGGFSSGTQQSGFSLGTPQSGGFTTGLSTGTTQSGFTTGTTLGGFTTGAAQGSFAPGGFATGTTLGGFASGGGAQTQAQGGIAAGITPAVNTSAPTTTFAASLPQPTLTAPDLSTPQQTTGFSFGIPSAKVQPVILSTPSTLSQTTSTQSTGFSMTGTPAKVAASSISTTGTTTTSTPVATPVWSLGGVTATAPASTLADTQAQLTTTTASSAAPTPAITFRQLEEDINKWTLELDEQEKVFLTQATQVNAWDALLISNGEKITELNETLQKVKLDQDSLEQEVDFIRSQQRELDEILVPLEKHVQTVPNISIQQHADLEREHTYELAENVDAQLRRMAQDLKEVIDQLNANTRSQDANSQINQVSKILNAHMDTLQWIDQHTTILQKKVEDVAKLQERRQQDQDRLQHLGRN